MSRKVKKPHRTEGQSKLIRHLEKMEVNTVLRIKEEAWSKEFKTPIHTYLSHSQKRKANEIYHRKYIVRLIQKKFYVITRVK